MMLKSWQAAIVFTCSPSSSRMLTNTSYRLSHFGVRSVLPDWLVWNSSKR
jgi:hypothetical protein